MSFIEHASPTHLEALCGNVPGGGGPIRPATSKLHVQYTHTGIRQFYFILSLSFRSQDKLLAKEQKGLQVFPQHYWTLQPSFSFGLYLRAKDMTITICHNKPPDRKWGWSVDDVMPRRDDPENLRILKRRQLGIRPLKDRVGFSTVEAWG